MDSTARIAELERELEALKEANDLLERGCVTLATGYMASRLRTCEERLEKAATEFIVFQRRLNALEGK